MSDSLRILTPNLGLGLLKSLGDGFASHDGQTTTIECVTPREFDAVVRNIHGCDIIFASTEIIHQFRMLGLIFQTLVVGSPATEMALLLSLGVSSRTKQRSMGTAFLAYVQTAGGNNIIRQSGFVPTGG